MSARWSVPGPLGDSQLPTLPYECTRSLPPPRPPASLWPPLSLLPTPTQESRPLSKPMGAAHTSISHPAFPRRSFPLPSAWPSARQKSLPCSSVRNGGVMPTSPHAPSAKGRDLGGCLGSSRPDTLLQAPMTVPCTMVSDLLAKSSAKGVKHVLVPLDGRGLAHGVAHHPK